MSKHRQSKQPHLQRQNSHPIAPNQITNRKTKIQLPTNALSKPTTAKRRCVCILKSLSKRSLRNLHTSQKKHWQRRFTSRSMIRQMRMFLLRRRTERNKWSRRVIASQMNAHKRQRHNLPARQQEQKRPNKPPIPSPVGDNGRRSSGNTLPQGLAHNRQRVVPALQGMQFFQPRIN